MQESDVSTRPVSSLPFWMRIGMACLMFTVAVVSMWDGLLRFEWVYFFCFGLFWVMYLPRQKGETFRAYIKKPRAVATLALSIAIMAGAVHSLYAEFTKHNLPH